MGSAGFDDVCVTLVDASRPLNQLTNTQSVCGAAGSTGALACGLPGTAIASYAYTLGAAGNRLSVAELSGRTVNYGYDDLYRLTSETIAGAAGSQNGTVSYQYDSVGNRTRITSTLPAIATSGLLNYDANDRTGTDPYDANGNLLVSGAGGNVYDFENRLIGAGARTIVYDGDGNRVSETLATGTTNFLVADQNLTGYAQVLDELQSGSVTRTYTWGLELISQRLTANGQGLSFYGFDGHGSVRFLTSSTGAVTDTYDYDAFGNLIASTGTTPNNYLFAGEQFDSSLGIYFMRARYYDQRLGRFWTADTFEGEPQLPLSLHNYLYALDNPVLLADPSGQSPLSDFADQLNYYLRLIGMFGVRYGAAALGQIAHTSIEVDVLTKLTPFGNLVLFEIPVPGGRIDLIVNRGVYEIKPLGGTLDPGQQLTEYLRSPLGRFLAKGTYPFDDYVNPVALLLPPPLPSFVSLHYELTSPGIIEYDYQFSLVPLLTTVLVVTIYQLARIAIAASQAQSRIETAGAFALSFI